MKIFCRITATMALIAVGSLSILSAQTTVSRPEVAGIYDEERESVPLTVANWRVGFGVGPSISTQADLIADFRAQERLFVRRQFSDLLQAEAGVGIHRIAGDYETPGEFDSHLWSFDVRGMIAPVLNDQWNPYGYVGVGYAIYRIIDPARDAINSEADVPVNEIGGGVILPLGVGVQFKPARQSRFALDMNVGYSMLFTDQYDGMAGGGNGSFISGLVTLQYLFHEAAAQYEEPTN